MTILISQKEISLNNENLVSFMHAIHAKGSLFRFKAFGYSMSPFIKDQDIITIESITKKVTNGDIVAFLKPDCSKFVVHRVITRKKQLLLKGDNCSKIDGFIPQENLIGKVIKIERNGKKISLGLGWEKVLISWLSKNNLLPILFFFPRKLLFFIRGNKNV
ncbi:MAG: S24/S26 family peptidase [Candidatus Margulisiibacteriota bacterium]|jgi:signal peptidase I